MEFIDKNLEDYCRSYSQKESELLNTISRETHLKLMKPRMLSGHLQGRFLSFLSRLLQPEFILEIGTFTGYSAICLAEGLQEDGKLISIDNNPELSETVKSNFVQSQYKSQLEFICGDAMEEVKKLSHDFDLVFIDADKENYMTYYDLVLPKMKTGGVIIADNVLWSGKVLMEESKMDKDTLALHKFNQMLSKDDRVEQMILPFRDGLHLIRKK